MGMMPHPHRTTMSTRARPTCRTEGQMRRYSAVLVCLGTLLIATGTAATIKQISGRGSASGAAATGDVLIKDVRLFDGEKTIASTSVLVRAGRVTAIGPDLERGNAAIVDGTG